MVRSRLFRLLVLLTPLATGCAVPLALFDRGQAPLPGIGDPAVRHGTLENGLRYFIRENREPARRAELRLAVNAGSILEDPDQLGLAHVVEHMAFNGTRSFERNELVGFLESVGMRFGADVNAYTSFDETVYMLTLPTDSAGVLRTGVQILEEWASAIRFDSLQIEQERAVVVEEWRQGQGAGSRLQLQQFPTLARGSRYAERMPIGTRESLGAFTHDALRRFYDDWYRPDLMAVVAVGDFDADEVEALIREHFGRIPATASARERPEHTIPGHDETLISVATDPELTSTSVSVYLKRPPRAWSNVGDYRAWAVESLAASMLINRLNEYSRQVGSPFLDVSSFRGRFIRALTTFALSARTPEGGEERALETLLLELERAARHGFTPSELEREKREVLRSMEQRHAERERTNSAAYAGEYVAYFLYGGVVLGSEREYRLGQEVIPRIGVSEVNEAVRGWTGAADRVVLVSAPERPGVEPPVEARLAEVAGRIAMVPLAAYEDSISDAPLMRQLPEPGVVVAEREIPEIGAVEWRLGNGARVILKATDFREEEILFAARSPGGMSLFDEADHVPALTSTAVVQAGGLGELSAADLRKQLAGSVVGVSADIGELYEGLTGVASPRDAETLFQLIHLKFTSPRADSVAFLAYREQARASMANRSASPDVAFRDTLRVTLAQGHPRAMPPSAEMFDRLDMQRSFEIYRDRFADASDFTFYFVGSFQPEDLRPHVERYLASLPDLGRVEQGRDLGIRPPNGTVEKAVRRGLEPRATTQIVFTGDFVFERSNVLAIQALADVLRIRLRETLREDLGGTYGADVRGVGSPIPYPNFQFSVGFGSDPDRVEELTRAVFQEIVALQNSGPSETDLQRVREIQFRAREVDVRQNHFWLTQMITYEQFGWDLAAIPAAADRAPSVSAEMIREAAIRYLDPENYVQVTLMPEA